MNFSQLVTHYVNDKDEFPQNETTAYSYLANLNALSELFHGNPVESFDKSSIRIIVNEFSGRPYRINALLGMLRCIMNYAVRQGIIEHNPIVFKRAHVEPRRAVWSAADENNISLLAMEEGRISLWVAVALSLYQGQRQTDVLDLRWTDYKHGLFVFRQSKTGERIKIPAFGPVKNIMTLRGPHLDEIAESSQILNNHIVINESTGGGYTKNEFRVAFAGLMQKARLYKRLQFRDLRRTCVVRMHEAGLTAEQISGVTGHRIERCRTIIETYLPISHRLTPSAIEALERFYEE